MKGNKKLLVVAVLLLLIAVSYGTYAIYRESAEGEATIPAAAWSVKIGLDDFKDVDFDFDLSDLTCTNNPGKAGTIAPGAECYIDYTIDADGSQVDNDLEETMESISSDNLDTEINIDKALEGTNLVIDDLSCQLDQSMDSLNNDINKTLATIDSSLEQSNNPK